MLSLENQTSPTAVVTAQTVCTGPPVASTRLRLPDATNAMWRPSGDQVGPTTPSVPGIGTDVPESKEWTHNCDCPRSPRATSAIFRPSGDRTATRATKGLSCAPDGSDTEKRVTFESGGAF